jgi:hypothetical protein
MKTSPNQALEPTETSSSGRKIRTGASQGAPCLRGSVQRSTNTIMKTVAFTIIAAFVAIAQTNAAAMENELIRKPGKYSLDEKGSALIITKEPEGSWSLKATWVSTQSGEISVSPHDCLLDPAWFVLTNKQTRVWVFNGIDDVILVSTSNELTGTTWSPGAAMRTCPRAFWDALPQEVRAKYPRVEPDGPANQSQPIRADTNRTSVTAGSDR